MNENNNNSGLSNMNKTMKEYLLRLIVEISNAGIMASDRLTADVLFSLFKKHIIKIIFKIAKNHHSEEMKNNYIDKLIKELEFQKTIRIDQSGL